MLVKLSNINKIQKGSQTLKEVQIPSSWETMSMTATVLQSCYSYWNAQVMKLVERIEIYVPKGPKSSIVAVCGRRFLDGRLINCRGHCRRKMTANLIDLVRTGRPSCLVVDTALF